jgi:hypothetical protein
MSEQTRHQPTQQLVGAHLMSEQTRHQPTQQLVGAHLMSKLRETRAINPAAEPAQSLLD